MASTGLALALTLLQGCYGHQAVTNPRSADAALIANLWWAMLVIGSGVLLAVVVLLVIGSFRSRGNRPERPLSPIQGWALVLAGGVVAPMIAILALVVSGVLIGREVASGPPTGALTLEIIGRQWWWEVHYHDRAGTRIATTANEIHIPVDQPVRFLLRSDNVIHSFWVPNLQGKTDLIPGQTNQSWVQAGEVGTFRGQCAEFCGVQHANMAFFVVVEPEDRFSAWLERQGGPAARPTDPLLVQGQNAFLSSGCAGCHTIRGSPAAGELGPDLTHLASRRTLAGATIPNTRGHLGGWISDPQQIKPGNAMPSTTMSPGDFRALLSYLESLE